MASLQTRKRKRGEAHIIQFTLDGKRRSLFLDERYDASFALEVKLIVEKCANAIETDAPLDRRTLAWLEEMSDDLQERFVACDLIERDDAETTIEELFEEIAEDERRRGLKESTIAHRGLMRRYISERLDVKTPLQDFGKSDARAFAAAVRASRYASATQSEIIATAKIAFNFAVEREYVDKSPFVGVPSGLRTNKAREFYVEMSTFNAALSFVPRAEVRAILTLYRVGGLRKSEPFFLRWRDVDFTRRRLRITSPKTERHVGKGSREAPLFPALARALHAWREESPGAPDDLVFKAKWRSVDYSYSAALTRAGVERYPRVFQNLRSSASIDIFREYGEIAENAWLGHSISVAKSHYLHVIEADFDRATRE